YSFKIGENYYEKTSELGPHISIFDWIIGSMKDRFPPRKIIEIRYNENNPMDTALGFEIFRPAEMLCGSAFICLVLGGIGLYLHSVVHGTVRGDDDELNQPLEYFLKKQAKERKDRDQMMR